MIALALYCKRSTAHGPMKLVATWTLKRFIVRMVLKEEEVHVIIKVTMLSICFCKRAH
jgi:hypothetical protein